MSQSNTPVAEVTISTTTSFTVQSATGVNPQGKALEMVDSDGVRWEYVNTVDEAVDSLHDMFNEEAIAPYSGLSIKLNQECK